MTLRAAANDRDRSFDTDDVDKAIFPIMSDPNPIQSDLAD